MPAAGGLVGGGGTAARCGVGATSGSFAGALLL